MIYQHLDYREFLQKTLTQRALKDPLYSLRAFARDLNISPAMLLSVIKGERDFSVPKARQVAQKLNLNKQKREHFVSLVELAKTEDMELKEELVQKLKKMSKNKIPQSFDVEIFKMISKWYHLSILEMSFVDNMELTAPNISQFLGITKAEAQDALDRLIQLELLTKDENGNLVKTNERFFAKSDVASSGLRHYHRQMLSKATESIATQSPMEKFVGSETFAFDPNDLEEAKDIIRNCFAELNALAEKGKNKSCVYHCGAQFFRVNKIARSKQ